MPVGRSDGDERPMRSYRGRLGAEPLGSPTIWSCPACLKQVEGTRPEQGCPHCGAGEPGTAGGAQAMPAGTHDEAVVGARTEPVHRRPPVGQDHGASVQKVYRLIEYTAGAAPGLIETLRRSLVGTLEFPWGSMTATIVDSLDSRQQDLLTLARRQPGVWLGGPLPKIDVVRLQQDLARQRRYAAPPPGIPYTTIAEGLVATQQKEQSMAGDTGHTPGAVERDIAKALDEISGPRLCYTLALALQMFAEQADMGMEAEKQYSSAECLRLAQALLDLIPADWDPQPEEPPNAPT